MLYKLKTVQTKRSQTSYQQAQRRGRYAEKVACWMLRLKGYRILQRCYKTPVGEIDIIAKRGKILAVIEVKNRPTFAEAIEAVTPMQRRRIERAVSWFLSRYPLYHHLFIRFDVALICWKRWPKHIMNAWQFKE